MSQTDAASTPEHSRHHDVVVVGAGNAAMCAALAANEGGARVLVLERAPEDEAGGNSRFTAGAIRFAYDGVDDLRALMPDLTDAEAAVTDFGTYSEADFYADMGRITDYRTDPELADTLVTRSNETLLWMAEPWCEVRADLGTPGLQSGRPLQVLGWPHGRVGGRRRGTCRVAPYAALDRNGIDLWHEAAGRSLVLDESGAVRGVRIRRQGRMVEAACSAVVLASGGFQANAEWRTRYLGPGWDLAKVRGTRFNTGDGIAMAFDAGAMPYGNWSGAHAVAWDYNAPNSETWPSATASRSTAIRSGSC